MAADDYTMGDLAQLSPDLLRQDAYTTPLSADDLGDYAKWKQKYAPHDSGYDYDLPGAYKAGLTPDASSGHFDDRFKKPNHPTFSTFSQYAKDRPDLAGTWNGDQYIPPADYSNVPGVGYVPASPMGSLADMTGMPSWLDRAGADVAKSAAAYQQGGVPAMFADTSEAQDLAGGFGGNIKGVGKGIKAYHGSPYDFEKFDISKIGTGEGAQAYGHGLYFAENEAVAKQYRDMIAANRAGNLPGQNIVDAHAAQLDKPQGRMYEVNINAEPGQFLDWDKPIGQQPLKDKAIDVLSRAGLAPAERGAADQLSGRQLNSLLASQSAMRASPIWEGISPNLNRDAAASELLQSQGIPGIRYLDQGSRFTPPDVGIAKQALAKAQESGNAADIFAARQALNRAQGLAMNPPAQTSNYVVFNPKIVDILKKYGLAGMLGTGAMGALATQDQYAQ